MDKDERDKSAEETARVEIVEAAEREDTFPQPSAEAKSGNSLLGRRNTGNNLYIKIPANEPDSQWVVAIPSSSTLLRVWWDCVFVRSGDSSASDEDEGEASGSNMGNNYRRNSISMPVLNTMDLDALRQLHEKAVQEKMVTL